MIHKPKMNIYYTLPFLCLIILLWNVWMCFHCIFHVLFIFIQHFVAVVVVGRFCWFKYGVCMGAFLFLSWVFEATNKILDVCRFWNVLFFSLIMHIYSYFFSLRLFFFAQYSPVSQSIISLRSVSRKPPVYLPSTSYFSSVLTISNLPLPLGNCECFCCCSKLKIVNSMYTANVNHSNHACIGQTSFVSLSLCSFVVMSDHIWKLCAFWKYRR